MFYLRSPWQEPKPHVGGQESQDCDKFMIMDQKYCQAPVSHQTTPRIKRDCHLTVRLLSGEKTVSLGSQPPLHPQTLTFVWVSFKTRTEAMSAQSSTGILQTRALNSSSRWLNPKLISGPVTDLSYSVPLTIVPHGRRLGENSKGSHESLSLLFLFIHFALICLFSWHFSMGLNLIHEDSKGGVFTSKVPVSSTLITKVYWN